MDPEIPLHPAIVHFPVALAALMPLLGGAAFVAWWQNWLPGRRLWVAVIACQALLVVGNAIALRTGEGEEKRVDGVVLDVALEHHEAAAELFGATAGAVLVLAAAAFVLPGESTRRMVALLSVIAMAAVAGLAYRTGKTGGELVYRYGAAGVYATTNGALGGPSLGESRPAGRDESRDRDEADDD